MDVWLEQAVSADGKTLQATNNAVTKAVVVLAGTVMEYQENDFAKDILNNAIEEVSEKELMEVAGGKRGPGWIATITDDCPNSIFVCC